jgi:hypothetical protein
VAPHAPQLALSVPRRLVSQPSLATALQLAKPGAHPPAAIAHAPATQLCVATWASAQARPQPPQCDTSLVVSVSQPLGAAPSQSPALVTQRSTAQVPAVHAFDAAPGSAHTAPHPPQLLGLFAVFAQ